MFKMPEEITLPFIARQLERMLTEQRGMRLDLRSLRDDLHSLRDEFGLLREQVRIQATTLARLNDTITMNVLDRLQALEDVARKPAT
jgi:hypothetical protein